MLGRRLQSYKLITYDSKLDNTLRYLRRDKNKQATPPIKMGDELELNNLTRPLKDFIIPKALDQPSCIAGISDEAIRLRLFPFSLKERALPSASITTWTSLASKFLAKFFPAQKTNHIRKEIMGVQQVEMENHFMSIGIGFRDS
ncbi:hypothetical protein L3X38_033013 [Prunus dulcis]|uniref:Uncharacterized protein n=1 Tax=Prunus dulcis TaxID=3755 RepID=A0AAD4VF52_PRUDU|nr:hypothetical protein L3X38_033013 [Prunus dulcis]